MKIGPSKFSKGGDLVIRHYQESGENALIVTRENGEPEYTASVALWPPLPKAGADEVFIKGWNECEGVPEALVAAGIVTLTDHFERTGYVMAQLAKLTAAAIAERDAWYAANPEAAKARAEAQGRPR